MRLRPDWPFLRISHRGAAGLEPENTLLGIETALRLGVEMVEIDVRPCADGTLVVVHDDDTKRVAGVPVLVSMSTVEELKRLDVGKGERIPTLDEVLALVRGRALINIDQKADNLAVPLMRAIDRAGSREETILSGYAPATFRAMQELAPTVPIALSIDAKPETMPLRLLARLTEAGANGLAGRLLASARAARADVVTLEWKLASAGVTERLKRAGLGVLTWTVDDPATMCALRDAGVDGITTNRPDLLMALG